MVLLLPFVHQDAHARDRIRLRDRGGCLKQASDLVVGCDTGGLGTSTLAFNVRM